MQARQSSAIGATLLFFLLLGMTVGPRLRVLSGVMQRFNAVGHAAPLTADVPTTARSIAKPRLLTRSRSAAFLPFAASASVEAPELDREDRGEPAVEVDVALPSTSRLELPALVSADQLDRVPPGVIGAGRPQSLTPLYITFAALQAADAITTIKALQQPGRYEVNPLVRPFARSVPALVVLKGASTVVTVVAVEKLWRKNRVAAVATMVGINVGYGILVSRNAALQ